MSLTTFVSLLQLAMTTPYGMIKLPSTALREYYTLNVTDAVTSVSGRHFLESVREPFNILILKSIVCVFRLTSVFLLRPATTLSSFTISNPQILTHS